VIEIIGAPIDLGGKRLGSRLGPCAIRLADIVPVLTGLGLTVFDRGDVAVDATPDDPEGFRGFSAIHDGILQLRAQAEDALNGDSIPLVLGGEHTVALGGISAAAAKYGPELAVLWIDAHADVNCPATSLSSNLHGMPIAALQNLSNDADGLRSAQWSTLLESVAPSYLRPDQFYWYGLRDVDAGERPRVKQGFAVTMHDIDRHGIDHTVRRLDRELRANNYRKLWISFDVDALDPILAPGTGTAVRGGLTYREAHLLAELLRDHMAAEDCPYRLAGIDVVEVNPLIDSNNETARVAVEWVASLLGKTIL